MLFGRSLFQSLVTRLDRENAVATDETAPQDEAAPARHYSLSPSFFTSAAEAGSSPEAAGDIHAALAYLDMQQSPPKAPEPLPAHLLRLAESEIAEELAISPADTPAMLAAKRRRFARDNHPDTVPAHWRDKAEIRMRIANLLIDRALRQVGKA